MKYLVKKQKKQPGSPPSSKLTGPQLALRRAKIDAKKERLRERDTRFLAHCEKHGLPVPVTEYKFAKEGMGRDWRIDFFFEANGVKVALEIEGGVSRTKKGVKTFGRHMRGEGYLGDMEKYNAMMDFDIKLHRVINADLFIDATVVALKRLLGLIDGKV